MFNRRSGWMRKVNKVFDARPRDGEHSSLWFTRHKLETELSGYIGIDGAHLCIDGPTGTGKSSLIATLLSRKKVKYALIQVAQSMDWKAFCKELVTVQERHHSEMQGELHLGVKSFLPDAGIKISFKKALPPLVDGTYSEHELGQAIEREQAVLVIDDFEKAAPDIIKHIADLAKILTQTYHGQIILVGTGSFYYHLCRADIALQDRIKEVTLGTLERPNETWAFLAQGFEALGLVHPGNSKYDKAARDDYIRWTYEAVDGLPKSITRFGRELCHAEQKPTAITSNDIKEKSLAITKQNLRTFRGGFSTLLKMLENSTEIRMVLNAMYRNGSARVMYYDDLLSNITSLEEGQIEYALQELVRHSVLVRTGRSEEVIYVENPVFAYTLAVVGQDPARFGERGNRFAPFGQLQLFPR